jgi:hypothetical protein
MQTFKKGVCGDDFISLAITNFNSITGRSRNFKLESPVNHYYVEILFQLMPFM